MSIEIRKNIRDILPKRAKEAFQKFTYFNKFTVQYQFKINNV